MPALKSWLIRHVSISNVCIGDVRVNSMKACVLLLHVFKHKNKINIFQQIHLFVCSFILINWFARGMCFVSHNEALLFAQNGSISIRPLLIG